MKFPVLAAAAALSAACCQVPISPELFAVLPASSDGHVGKIVVSRGGHDRVLDSAYAAQRIRDDGSTQAATLTESEVRAAFGPTRAALPGTPTSYTLYFLEGRDELTPESAADLDKVFAEIKVRPLPDIMVIGHSDTVGGLSYNDRLSLARAERMREMMIERGIPADRIGAAGRGKRELLVPTEENISEPRNRRVEINVR